MDLSGKRVSHKKYGNGIIQKGPFLNSSGASQIVVAFDSGEIKTFNFPDAFEKAFLSALDREIISEIESVHRAEAKRKREEIDRKEKELADIKAGVKRDVVFSGKPSRIFIVHQGITFESECEGGYLWAPQSGIFHHEKMTEIHEGDIIFNYSNGICAISEALCDTFKSKQPIELYGNGWDNEGYEVLARYELIAPPLSLDPIKGAIVAKRSDQYSSFDRNGNANQGYLYDLEPDIAKLIAAAILKRKHSAKVASILKRLP
jgi:hypothetical protein